MVKWEPYSENSTGRKLRSWFRGLHTGEAFGFFGQTIAGLASLGGCFLVWTGLAMAWRRFRSWGREVEEPSVTQPALSKDAASIEISQDLHLEGEKSSMELEILPGESSQLGHATDRNGTAAHRHEAMRNYSGRNSVLILFGTVTGNAESLAQRTAEVIARRGFNVRVKDMAHYTVDALSQEKCVVFITSTYGNGEPPDDAAPFWEAVVQKDGLDLRGVKFSVWRWAIPPMITSASAAATSMRLWSAAAPRALYPRVDCDVDYDVPAKRWTEGLTREFAAEPWCFRSGMMKEGVMAMLTFQLTSIAILILSLINTAHAHYVWLERDGEGSAYAYFGEWVDDIREKAGGLLDRIKAPRAFLGASTTPLPIKRHEDKLEITATGKGDLRLVENRIPPRDDSEKGGKTRQSITLRQVDRRPTPNSTWSWSQPPPKVIP